MATQLIPDFVLAVALVLFLVVGLYSMFQPHCPSSISDSGIDSSTYDQTLGLEYPLGQNNIEWKYTKLTTWPLMSRDQYERNTLSERHAGAYHRARIIFVTLQNSSLIQAMERIIPGISHGDDLLGVVLKAYALVNKVFKVQHDRERKAETTLLSSGRVRNGNILMTDTEKKRMVEQYVKSEMGDVIRD
ncbi:hypothetical protein EDD18DRAFT_1104872 [Armillaria luteobubalina]|uniref:Uncharacterized protein n=1 Tax=Armillaria luteobubalina TaxID=153913 RepID=A0AA39TQA6_9AGAR|nr:hypothetical protein EDD18DRAFT_1104872 [Armillaria luteobubalina]